MTILTVYFNGIDKNDYRQISERLEQSMISDIHKKDRLNQKRSKSFNSSPCPISIEKAEEDYRINIVPKLPDFQLVQHGPIVYETIAYVLGQYIVDECECAIIAELLKRRCKLTNMDTGKIAKYCHNLLNNDPWEPLGKRFSDEDRVRRRNKIVLDLIDYLEENSVLELAGYIAFRMHSYKQELKEVIEYAIDEYVLDQQYEEFMTLLKYFVQLQETRTELVHLVQEEGSSFIVCDDQMQPLEHKHEHDRIVAEMLETEINIEDIVISALISASPQKIIVHTKHEDYQVVRSVKAIFGDRAHICKTCPMCRHNRDELVPFQ